MIFLFISMGEIVIIAVIALLIFGPDKLPEIARSFGEGVRAMRRASDSIKEEIFRAAHDVENSPTVREIESEINEAKQIVENEEIEEHHVEDENSDEEPPVTPVKR